MLRANLIAATEDINKTLGLDPELLVNDDMTDMQLCDQLRVNGEQVVSIDPLMPVTWIILANLGNDIARRIAAGLLASEKEGNSGDSFPEKEKTVAPRISPNRRKYTRNHCMIDALKIGGTRKELIKLMDEFYVKNGGKAYPSGAKSYLGHFVPFLLLLGVLEITDKKTHSVRIRKEASDLLFK